jgi:hypothetical protein
MPYYGGRGYGMEGWALLLALFWLAYVVLRRLSGLLRYRAAAP